MRIAPAISNFTKRRYLFFRDQDKGPTVFASLSPTDEAACRITRPRGPSAPPSAYDPALLKYRLFITVKYLPNRRQKRVTGIPRYVTNMASKLACALNTPWTNLLRSIEKAAL